MAKIIKKNIRACLIAQKRAARRQERALRWQRVGARRRSAREEERARRRGRARGGADAGPRAGGRLGGGRARPVGQLARVRSTALLRFHERNRRDEREL
jgi:hypothetical protein